MANDRLLLHLSVYYVDVIDFFVYNGPDIPTYYRRGGRRKFFCGHGESLAKVKFIMAQHVRSWKKEF